ncbi:MAG: DUF3465 domain-containing protein [Pseudomonadota bacterium]|nr:MAG: DUF3465 domain-containing protein [Pseudomonadota bacterium]
MVTTSRVVLIILMVCGVAGCGGGEDLPPNDRLLAAFEEGRTGVWVSGHGVVAQAIGDETIAGEPHQRMVVRVGDQQLAVIIRHSLSQSDRIPLSDGDTIAFQGRYQFNGRGGVISHTYHDPEQPGSGGWIRHQGQVYD